MAVVHSIKSGPWSAASTWSGGAVPAQNDTITISPSTVVTLDTDQNLDGRIDLKGELSINSGVTLTLGSGTTPSTTVDFTFDFGPGSKLSGAGSIYSKNGKYTSSANALDWAEVGGNVAFVGQESGQSRRGVVGYDLRYVAFTTTADQYFPCHTPGPYTAGNNDPIFSFANCTFNGQGTVRFGGGNNSPQGMHYRFNRCDFREITLIMLSGPNTLSASLPVGDKKFTNCTFVNRNFAGEIQRTMITDAETGYDFSGSVLINCQLGVNSASRLTHASNAFVSSDLYAAAFFYSTHANSSFTDGFVYIPGSGPGAVYARAVTVAHLLGGVGQCGSLDAASVHIGHSLITSQTTKDCLHIGYGDLAKHMTTASKDWLVENCTSVIFAGANAGGSSGNAVFGADSGRITPLTTGLVVRNNLHYSLDVTVKDSVRTTGSTLQNIDGDYNCRFNVANAYSSNIVNTSADGGAHDFIADPEFKDPSREFVSWVRLVTGNAAATYIDGYEYFATSLNGYDPASKMQNPDLTRAEGVRELIDWLREGFTPQNMALATAGKDGHYVGAIQPASAETSVTEFDRQVTANEKYLPVGTTSDPALLRQAVDIPAGWSVTGVNRQGAYGSLLQDGGAWFYVLSTPYTHGQGGGTAIGVDAAALDLTHPDEGAGILTVHAGITSDITVLSASGSISGTDSANGTWFVNFGANAPGLVSWKDGSGVSHALGETADMGDYTVSVHNGSITFTRLTPGVEVVGQIELLAVDSEGTSATARVVCELLVPPVIDFEAGVSVNEKYLPQGTTPDAALLRQVIPLENGWLVAGVEAQGRYGAAQELDGVWYYVFSVPYTHGQGGGLAENADTVLLALTGPDNATGQLTVTVSIMSDITVISAPARISGEETAQGAWSVNFGANAPGTVSWEDENGVSHALGTAVVFADYSVTVAEGSISVSRTTSDININGKVRLVAVDGEGSTSMRLVSFLLNGARQDSSSQLILSNQLAFSNKFFKS